MWWWIVLGILVFLIVLFGILMNHTTIFMKPIRKNMDSVQYSTEKDLWFKKKGNKKLAICLHGMMATPGVYAEIGKQLSDVGWDVYAPALPDSSPTQKGLKHIGGFVWGESVIVAREKIQRVPRDYQEYAIIGHSQGGALTLEMLEENIIRFSKGIVLEAPVSLYGKHMPMFHNVGVYLSGLLMYLFPKGIPYHWTNKSVHEISNEDQMMFPNLIFTMKLGLAKVRKNLHKINVPMLVVAVQDDQIVDSNNGVRIMENVSSKIVVLVHYKIPRNEAPYDIEHQILHDDLVKGDLYARVKVFLNNDAQPK